MSEAERDSWLHPSAGTTSGCTVVVPVYNSQGSLPPLVDRLGAVLPGVAARFEVVLVNDGSRDGSWAVIGQLARKHPWIRGVNLMRNYGQHNALLAGIRAARFAVIVTMDDDLQHPPEEIPRLLEALGQDGDLVYGTPIESRQGAARALSSRITRLWLHRVLGSEIASRASAFRAFRTVLREGFAHYEGPAVAIDALLAWTTTRVATVPVRHDPRRHGRSQYGWLRLARLAIDLTTTFRTWPLRLASVVGFLVMAFGLGLLAFVVGSYFVTGQPLSVFRFLAAVLAIFSGAQLFTLGILGEYVARIHHRVLREPSYVVRERIGDPDDGGA
jgi:undecaprenyl-phosphate 4-deoxy-4-formamido-L-arabinose transferase